ncbi:MAG TPA: hypothetical protein VG711_09915, partial [Phycisphaerales bacterium]|nr:hypothetical protein [Phycisphaerales bacterium]
MACSPALLRMIDANLNRAAEALRTMEDVARFVLDHQTLSEQCKNLRHDLHAEIKRLPIPAGGLIASRDTSGDVGTSITNSSEHSRADVLSIAATAGSRAAQALRVLEESAKTLDPDAAKSIEAIRYRTYTADQQLQLAF